MIVHMIMMIVHVIMMIMITWTIIASRPPARSRPEGRHPVLGTPGVATVSPWCTVR
jgi:hypothetical protein